MKEAVVAVAAHAEKQRQDAEKQRVKGLSWWDWLNEKIRGRG